MKPSFIAILLLATASIVVWLYQGSTEKLLQKCPTERIVNRMPVIDPSGPDEYYILDGERREISEFDADWVRTNCSVPVQEVF